MVWNVLMRWLPSELFILLSMMQLHTTLDVKTRTITLSSNSSIACENDLKINIKNIDIIHTSRQCTSGDGECRLTKGVANMVKNDCEKKVACTIDMHKINTDMSGCLMDFGHFNFTYSCEANVVSCNFDTDWCDWLTQASNSGKFRWERERYKRYSKIPPRDHTTASPSGVYAYIYSKKHNKEDFAELYLENIVSSTEQCLSFWYYITDTKHVLEVLLDDQNIKNGKQLSTNNWHQAKISIPESSAQYKHTYKIIFKVNSKEQNTNGALAVDDILFTNRACSDVLYECNFENNACYADYEPSIEIILSKYSWIHNQGQKRYSHTGPQTDHTTGSNVSGFYMYLDSVYGSKGDIAYTMSSSMKVNKKSCLTFWYHMYGYQMGRLNVTLNSNLVWSDYGNKGDKWNIATIDIDPQDDFTFQFVGIYGSGSACDIAIDDILLLPGSCAGLIEYKNICVDLDDGQFAETYCPKRYLDFMNSRLLFDPEKNDVYCSSIYHQTKMRLQADCEKGDISSNCMIDLSTDLSSHPECFHLYEFRILYTCEEEETTTVSTDTTSREDSSSAEETTTVSSFSTSRESSSAVSDEIVTLSKVMRNSSDSATGLVVGLVIGALLLVCVVIVIVIIIRRNTFKSNPIEKIRNNLGGNDYIGSQDIALPLTANQSSHMQNNCMYDGSNNTNVHGNESTDANAQVNNVQHQYTNIGAANGFVSKEKVQVLTYAHSQEKTFADNNMSNDDEYAIVDPTAETSFNDSIDNRTGAAGSYIISSSLVDYEFAKPVKNTENNICDEDQYDISDEGVYDHSGSNRHKESEDNIYNHAVDAIYDSGSHKRNNEGREDTYDHFFGQKTEDDYDISTTT